MDILYIIENQLQTKLHDKCHKKSNKLKQNTIKINFFAYF